MQFISIDTNMLQILFDPAEVFPLLGSFLKIVNPQDKTGVLGQIIEVKNFQYNPLQYIAVVKILFSIDNSSIWKKWTGNIPKIDFNIEIVQNDELFKQLQKGACSINMGVLTQQNNARLNLNKDGFKGKTFIFSDQHEERVKLVSHLTREFSKYSEKILIVDSKGLFGNIKSSIKITAGKDFKLPLNSKSIDSIYEKSLNDASAESRAVIEDVLSQVKEYADSCDDGYIPFKSFKDVVEEEYRQSSIVELVLLKNSLSKYYKDGIFADRKENIESLFNAFNENNVVILDLTEISSEWHKNYVDFVISDYIKSKKPVFFVIESDILNPKIANKLLVKGVNSGISPLILVSYTSRLLELFINHIQNLIMFAPKTQLDKVFAIFAGIMPILTSGKFLIHGNLSDQIPLISDLKEQSPQYEQIESVENSVEVEQNSTDVSGISVAENSQETPVEEPFSQEKSEEPLYYYEDVENHDEEIIDYIEDSEFNLSEEDLDKIAEYRNNSEPENRPYEEITQEISQDVEQLYTAPKAEEPSPELKPEEPQEKPQVKTHPLDEIPVFAANYGPETPLNYNFEEGDKVRHEKYGIGVVKKIISYGNKKLCSIHFDNVGRRLLDPDLALIEKL